MTYREVWPKLWSWPNRHYLDLSFRASCHSSAARNLTTLVPRDMLKKRDPSLIVRLTDLSFFYNRTIMKIKLGIMSNNYGSLNDLRLEGTAGRAWSVGRLRTGASHEVTACSPSFSNLPRCLNAACTLCLSKPDKIRHPEKVAQHKAAPP